MNILENMGKRSPESDILNKKYAHPVEETPEVAIESIRQDLRQLDPSGQGDEAVDAILHRLERKELAPADAVAEARRVLFTYQEKN